MRRPVPGSPGFASKRRVAVLVVGAQRTLWSCGRADRRAHHARRRSVCFNAVRRARDIGSAGTEFPVPRYISSGVCPRNRRRREFAVDPRRAPARFVSAIVRIKVRRSAGTVSRPSRRRLFQVHQSRKPCRCQAMTVSGFTRTSAVRHPAQMRASMTQNHRSVLASQTRCGRVRC